MSVENPIASFVVVAFNSGKLLLEAVPALLADYPLTEVIVVDSASRDGSVDALRKEFGEHERVTILVNVENKGFGAAANRGLEIARAPWVATVNPDTRLERGWLEALLEAARSDEALAMLGGTLLDAAHPERVENRGLRVDELGMARPIDRGKRVAELSSEPFAIDAPMGGAALWRTDALRAVRGFDQRFFMYYEEVDLSQRLARKGWRAQCVPAAQARHIAHQSGLSRAQKRFHLQRNRLFCLAKNWPRERLMARLPRLILREIGVTFVAALEGRASLAASLKARREALARWGEMRVSLLPPPAGPGLEVKAG